MCKITLQDNTVMEYPKPVKSLKIGQNYWYLSFNVNGFCCYHAVYEGRAVEKNILSLNIAHDTKKGAKQHVAAFKAINSQQDA